MIIDKENLMDAGCCGDTIEEFIKCQEEGKIGELLCILGEHRAELLENIHEGQKKLDCLDYLIYKIKAAQKESVESRLK